MLDPQPMPRSESWKDQVRRAQEAGGVPPDGWLDDTPRGSTLAEVDVPRLGGPRPEGWPDDEIWVSASRRALAVIGERLARRLAPIRVLRYASSGFILGIDGPLDEAGAGRLGAQIAEIVGEPIPGIAEPLAAHTGFTLRRVAASDAIEVLVEADAGLCPSERGNAAMPRSWLPLLEGRIGAGRGDQAEWCVR